MRISDWSSDVCSSDLRSRMYIISARVARSLSRRATKASPTSSITQSCVTKAGGYSMSSAISATARATRSEEHTSELQYLKRNSYAVFCFKNNHNLLLVANIANDDSADAVDDVTVYPQHMAVQ